MPVCSRNTILTLVSQDRTRLPSLQFRNAPQAVLRGDRAEPRTQPHSIFDGCDWHEKLLSWCNSSAQTARSPHWEWQPPVLTPWYDTIILCIWCVFEHDFSFFTFDMWSSRLPRSTWYFLYLLFESSHHDIWNLLTIYGSCDRDGWNWDMDNFFLSFSFSFQPYMSCRFLLNGQAEGANVLEH